MVMETDNSLFNQGVDYLVQARDEIVSCNELDQRQKQLHEKSEKMKKVISQEDKSIHDEINATIKKRKGEIEDSYDRQLDDSRKKMKRAQDEKNKEKSDRIDKRVDVETAGAKEKSRQLKTEMKTLFKKNHVPGFCRSGLYYSLFMPKGFKEFMLLFLMIIIGLAGIPFGMYMLFSKVVLAGKPIVEASYFMTLVIAITLVIVLGIYFLIFNLTKVRHRDTIAEGRKIRNQMRANEKNIQAIKNAINKDKDESQYELGEYDDRIQQIQEELDRIAQQKQGALTEFEQQTKQEIKRQQEAVEAESVRVAGEVKQASLAITDKYAKYLGKNICKEEALNDIISIMETEQIDTISEGLAIYKGEAPHKGQEPEA